MFVPLKTLLRLSIGAALTFGFVGTSTAQLLVVPGINATTEGNSNNGWPFNASFSEAMRYQQVYGASAFSALSGPALITQIAFRADAAEPSGSVNIPNLQVNFSTTAVGTDALSMALASNVGANDTVVFSGSLSFATVNAGSPKPFNFIITLTTPFLYNPAAGNLLLDVRNLSGNSAPRFGLDAEFTSGDAVSRAWSLIPVTPDVITGSDSLGLVTRFTFVPSVGAVPEPSTYGFVAGVVLMAGIAIRRRRE